MDFRCPLCQSLIYSRKNKLCGVCGKPLPAELLFTDEQIAALKKESDQEEKRAKDKRAIRRQIRQQPAHQAGVIRFREDLFFHCFPF